MVPQFSFNMFLSFHSKSLITYKVNEVGSLILEPYFLLNQHSVQFMHVSFIFYGIVVLWKGPYSEGNELIMNCTRKFCSTSIPKDLSLTATFVIQMKCSCMVCEPSNFMVVKVPISVPTRDLQQFEIILSQISKNLLHFLFWEEQS